MSWMLSVWVATALLALCRGRNTVHEGNSLSESGYHLCVHNETRNVSFLVMHTVPYALTKPCGGWLLWKTCTVTLYRMTHQTEHKTVMEQVTRCCSGYEQVGRYCARSVNRSDEITAKPGSCPTADGLCPRSGDCEWDMDCLGWQKCCHRSGSFLCTDPTSWVNYSENGGYRFNATVTVKTDYQQLISSERGILNHTRLLQAMVTGALQSDISVYYLSSQPVHPYRTATSLLIDCNFALSLHNVTSKLHHLLKHIQEVTSVSVEDVDECAQSALRQCSLHADCNNTVGSYRCACPQGFIDVDPRNPGAHCTAPPSITSVWSANVTGTSFHVYWSSRFKTNQTYQVVLRRRSEVIQSWMTSQTMVKVRDLQRGVLYNVTLTPCSCGSQGVALGILVKTDAQTLNATARLTNIQFTADLHNTSSQAYENLTESIKEEIYQSLSPEMKAMVDYGQLRIDIRSFSPGSVVVNFTIVFNPSQSQDIGNVSTALLHSLMNSTKYTVDKNNTSTNDFNECASEENDCSQWATCTNTWASYTCVCQDGFIDNNPERPGRACQADVRATTTTELPLTSLTPTNTPYTPASNSTQEDPLSMSSTVEPPLPTTACSPPSITSAWSANITGTSFRVYWSSRFETNQTYQVVLRRRSEVIQSCMTSQTMVEVRDLQPGVLYNVTLTPCSCGRQGVALGILVKTDAQTLNATARLTNIQFTADLHNTSSQAYENLTESIKEEIYQSLSPEMKAMVDYGQLRIDIRSFSPGSVVVNFTIVFNPSQSQDIGNVSTALLHSLMNSTKYTVDKNNTSTNDFNECASEENDCSQWATCTNTWASYTCVCQDGFIDNNPERPGRACQANNTAATAKVTASTANNTAPAITTPAPTTNNIEITSTAPTTNMTVPAITNTAPTTNITVPAITTTTPVTFTALTTATTATATTMISITSTTTTTIASPTTTSTAPATTDTPLRTATNVSMLGAISVQCRVAAITLTVTKDFLLSNKIREHTLYLGLPECGVNGGNATHAQLTVAWNECGTSLVHNETYYMASVTLFNTVETYTSDGGILEVPRIRLEAPILCTYMKSTLISADFGSMGYDMIEDFITGSGSFQVTVQLMNGTMPLPNNHSLSSDEAVVVEVSLNSSSEQIKVIINKCWATPTQNPADSYSLTFLENSCSLNTYTNVLMNGNSSTSRVSVKIFSIVDLDVIYLHCLVHICVEIGSDICVPDCLQRTVRSSKTIRTAVISSGSLLKTYDESLEEGFSTLYIAGLSCLGIGLTLFLIIGFVCIFYFQRNRIGHYNFSVKPKQENFTYLVFNT
ncbi:uromodulin-like 1 isoform X1 [Cebidichthys violaceus]|uniref:uromodulin-like 1 isoform X1 n=1 Tax=Cebidichthys violaceus TaxID=271503 RepID=UPI0035CA6C4A